MILSFPLILTLLYVLSNSISPASAAVHGIRDAGDTSSDEPIFVTPPSEPPITATSPTSAPDTVSAPTTSPPFTTIASTLPAETTCVLADGTTVIVVGGGPCPIHEPTPQTSVPVSTIPVTSTTFPPNQECFLPNGQTIEGPCPTVATTSGVAIPTTTATYVTGCILPDGQTSPCSTTISGSTSAPVPVGTITPMWGQCGGTGFIGSTICVDGTYCKLWNDFFSQCLPNGE